MRGYARIHAIAHCSNCECSEGFCEDCYGTECNNCEATCFCEL